MLNLVKDALRISSNDMDTELGVYIAQCKTDLARVGINATIITAEGDTVKALVILYCKYMLNWRADGERYRMAYEGMRDGFSLYSEFQPEA